MSLLAGKQLLKPLDISGSLTVTGSINVQGTISAAGVTASLLGTASWAEYATTASYALNISGTVDNAISASYAQTASFAPSYIPNILSGSFVLTSSFNNYTSSVVSTASFNNYTSSVVSTASFNAFTSSYNTGSFTGSFRGTLVGTASWAANATTASYSLQAVSSSFATSASHAINAINADTASAILGGKINHVPYFITDTAFATSSIYQSGSSTVIINQDNATSENPEALYVWQPSDTSFNVISGKGNLNNYLQLNIQNTNQGTNASSDVVATAGNGNEGGNYIDMGINSNNFNGFLGGPDDAYLYATGSHLHIGNATPNMPIQFFVGGVDTNADRKFELNANNLHNMTGSLEIDSDLTVLGGITGSLYGSASYAQTASFAPAYLPLTGGTIDGNVTVNGTASVTFLNVTYESASVIYSSGSNQFGDNTDDIQTLIGTVIVSGSQHITGSLNASSITGSLFGSSSYAITASYALNAGGTTIDTGSYVITSSFNAYTGSVVTTSSFNTYTGSNTSQFAGTASFAQTASLAQTASFAQTASYVLQAVSSSFTQTASLAQTASFAQTASYVLQAVSSSFAQTASYVQTAQTASYVAAANVAGTVLSASHAVQADSATNATYAATAGNGGVTRLINGSGITLLPSNGQGDVTVIASAGGGVTIISGSLVTGSFVNATSYTFNHNLNTRTPIITVFDSNYNQIIPENIQLVDSSSATITFPTQESGFAIGSTGGTTGTAFSSSYALFSDYAQTASYYTETDPIFVAKSGSYATTGSNRFIGNQTITGSLIVSGSSTFTNVGAAIFTGSVNISGSTILNGTTNFYGNHTLSGSNLIIGSTILSGSLEVSGSTVLHNSSFIVTGSTSIKGTTQISGSTGITGSFEVRDGDINIVSGSSFTRWGNKLFNYGQFSSLQTQSGSANTAYAMKLDVTDFALGTSITNNVSDFPTRITIQNTGIYNLQFSAQLTNTANTNITFDIWFAYTGSNIANTNTQIDVNKSAGQLGRSVAAWNLATPITAGDYIEIMWSCNAATGQIVTSPTATTPTRPAVPSLIATLTQIA